MEVRYSKFIGDSKAANSWFKSWKGLQAIRRINEVQEELFTSQEAKGMERPQRARLRTATQLQASYQ
jgi:hypothetical protein